MSSHDHIKITSKLKNNHHSESPEIWLNRSPIIKNFKKSHIDIGRNGRDSEKADPTPCVMVKNQEVYFSCRGPPEEVRGSSPSS